MSNATISNVRFAKKIISANVKYARIIMCLILILNAKTSALTGFTNKISKITQQTHQNKFVLDVIKIAPHALERRLKNAIHATKTIYFTQILLVAMSNANSDIL